jgi:hypothetical protein
LTYSVDLQVEPRGEAYCALLEAALPVCDRGLLVIRERAWLNEAGEEVLHALRPSLIGETRSNQWPGTVLLSGQADVLTYEYTTEVIAVLTSVAKGLYDWVAPLPEDLCLLRGDDAWLVSIAHERDAFIRVDDASMAQSLLNEFPILERHLHLRS